MLTDELKQQIQSCYRTFLQRKQLKPRYGQRLMIAEIAKCIAAIELDEDEKRVGSNHICVIEAGTGTGKTLAYLLGALPVAKTLGKKVVLATATVALQDQVVNKDIPDLLKNSDLVFTTTLAKGRSRYLCLNKLDQIMTPGNQAGTNLALWEDYQQYAVDKHEAELYREMDVAVESGKWAGDRDSWPEEVEDLTWRRVTNDHRGCTGRNCGFYEDCPFYLSRNNLYRSDLIVANHDLVLADLAMGGGVVLPAPEDTIYIFDEGHHLPDKALNHFSCNTQLRSSISWLSDLSKMLDGLSQDAATESLAHSVHLAVQEISKELGEGLSLLLTSLIPLAEGTELVESDQGKWLYRFEKGLVPEAIQLQASSLLPVSQSLQKQLQMLVDWLQEGMDGKRSDISRSQAEAWAPVVATQLARIEAICSVWMRFQQQEDEKAAPCARWLNFSESAQGVDIELNACPVLASDVLAYYLWNRAFAAIVTSATLSALGSFDRFQFRSGVPRSSLFTEVPSPFNYQEAGRLRIPAMASDPTRYGQHTESIVAYLEDEWQQSSATLVLFTSRKQLEDVFEALPEAVRSHVLAQGRVGKFELIRLHKERVDNGEYSLIFGLASFAEGVDLPGDYCSRVVIVRLPFSVPEDPVDATLAEWVESRGGNAFMQISVPDAAIRLKQSAGRLLRTETDKGEVVILDRRIIEKRYGRLLINSLPPFTLIRE